jgi:hypothetical protein
MKIRTCFVANSSTTSFVLYGVNLPEGALGDYDEDERDFYTMARNADIAFHWASEEGWGYYIGIEPENNRFLDKQLNDKAREEAKTKVNKFLDELGYKGVRDFGVFAESYLS